MLLLYLFKLFYKFEARLRLYRILLCATLLRVSFDIYIYIKRVFRIQSLANDCLLLTPVLS